MIRQATDYITEKANISMNPLNVDLRDAESAPEVFDHVGSSSNMHNEDDVVDSTEMKHQMVLVRILKEARPHWKLLALCIATSLALGSMCQIFAALFNYIHNVSYSFILIA